MTIASSASDHETSVTDDPMVSQLVDLVPAPPDRRKSVANQLRQAMQWYREWHRDQTPRKQASDLLKSLYCLVLKAICSNDERDRISAIEAYRVLPADVRAALSGSRHPPLHDEIRTSGDLRRLCGFIVAGQYLKPGRKRPGGKQSRPAVVTLFRIRSPRGRPRREREKELLEYWLRPIWHEATDKASPRQVDDRSNLPYQAWLKAVFQALGVRSIDIRDLVSPSRKRRRRP